MYQPVKNALESLGNRGKYQKLLVAFLFFIAGEVNYLLFAPTFIFMNPLFRCSFSEELVDESVACGKIDQCQIENDFTIVASANLYCDGQVDRNIIQAVPYVGAIIGLLVVNFVSDKKGRKYGMIMGQLVAIFGVSLTILGGYSSSVPILAISQFLCGFSGYSMIIMAYILPAEFCQDQFRQKLIVIINYAWSLTILLIGVLYYVYNQWDNFLIEFVLIPMIGVFLISCFFLVQGPNYLYGAKREKQCLESLKMIACYNNTLRQFEIASANFKYQSSQTKQHGDQTKQLKEILKDKHYLKVLILLIFVDVGGNLYYTGTNFALDEIGLNYGANMIASGLLEFLGFLSIQFVITKLPRKKTLIITYGFIALLGLLFIIQPLRESQTGTLIIIGICRYVGPVSYTILIMMLTECFPLNVQAMCAGIVQSIAQLGGFLGPIIITICINAQIYPLIILSVIIILIVVFPLFAITEKKVPQALKNETLLSEDQS